MGIIDDLAMGLGMKARTEDYDARTAATLRREGNDAAATQYLQSRGRGADYNPAVAQDSRPFMQRLLFSQQGAQSPTPYSFGPVKMDQAMPAFGPLGLLMRFMAGKGQEQQDPRVASAIADLQNKSKWMANVGGQGGRVTPTSPTVTPKDYSVYSDIDFPMYIPQSSLATGPEYSGKYPQAVYEAGFDDIFLDSEKIKNPANFAGIMRQYGVAGY